MSWDIVRITSSDYQEYGGDIERWKDPNISYPDCSSGCRWFWRIDSDWGVCSNPNSQRAGLLTWEHQSGFECFEPFGDKEND